MFLADLNIFFFLLDCGLEGNFERKNKFFLKKVKKG